MLELRSEERMKEDFDPIEHTCARCGGGWRGILPHAWASLISGTPDPDRIRVHGMLCGVCLPVVLAWLADKSNHFPQIIFRNDTAQPAMFRGAFYGLHVPKEPTPAAPVRARARRKKGRRR